MIIILPFDHDKLTVRRLPFVTIGIIALCILCFFLTTGAIDRQAEQVEKSYQEFSTYADQHEYLKLPDAVLKKKSKEWLEVYDARQEWLAWYLRAPDEVDRFLEEYLLANRTGGPNTGQIVGAMESIQALSGGRSAQLEEVKKDLWLSGSAKYQFLATVRAAGPEGLDANQEALNRLYLAYLDSKEGSILQRFGYIPARPSLRGLIAHPFLHGGILHLVFNMIFLWLAAVKLEDRWGRPVFAVVYLVFGAAGAAVHGLVHPESQMPMIGASGAVAGLMGAFLVRYARAEIRFVYAYLLFLRPRFGSFSAPAYLMLPLWFVGELFWALLDVGPVAYWAHVGGFAAGVVVALAFRWSRFEERVLGLEPEVEVRPEDLPLVAFQNRPDIAPEAGIAPDFAPGVVEGGSEEAPAPEAPPVPEAGLTPVPKPVPAPLAVPVLVPAAVPVSVPAAVPAAPPQKAIDRHMFRGLVKPVYEELLVRGVSFGGLEGATQARGDCKIVAGEVAFIAAGRVDRVGVDGRKYFTSGDLPEEPALVLAFVGPKQGGDDFTKLPCLVADGAKLPYAELMRKSFGSTHRNFVAFIKFLIDLYPGASYVPAAGAVAENNLPVYPDLEAFFRHVTKFAG